MLTLKKSPIIQLDVNQVHYLISYFVDDAVMAMDMMDIVLAPPIHSS